MFWHKSKDTSGVMIMNWRLLTLDIVLFRFCLERGCGMWKLKILSKMIKSPDCYEIDSKEKPETVREMEALWCEKRHVQGWCLLWLWVQWPWPADCSVWNGTHLSIVQISSVLMRNTKALGFLWPSFCLVMFHIIPAERSKANEVQQGHNFFKVFPWVIGRSRKRVWASDLKARDTPHKESDFKCKDRTWEGKSLGISI